MQAPAVIVVPAGARFQDSCCPDDVLNVPITDWLAVTFTVQLPVPEHPAPLHPANVDPNAAVAQSFTVVEELYRVLHVLPQLIPAGADVTVPAPVPAFTTERTRLAGWKL